MRIAPSRYHRSGGLIAIAWMAGSLLACTGPAPATSQDIADSVGSWVEAYERSWNARDAAAVAGFFAEDGDFIVGAGPRLVGRGAIEESWRNYFSGIDDARRGTFAIESLRVIAADVVLLNIASTTAGRDASGKELPTRLARGTWVIDRHDGEWQIAAFRALPAEGDMRFAPGTDR